MSTSRVYYIREPEYLAQKDGKEIPEIFTNLRSKRDILMTSLGKFYEKEENMMTFLPIVNGNSPLSLRVIDWFVTNYAKDHNIMYDICNESGELFKFMVYLDYKAQLKAYSKKQFDPFCRRERILFYVDMEDKTIEPLRTTVGQLNFFRWAIQNNVIAYIHNHLNDIENDMNEILRGGKSSHGRRKKSKQVKKEKQIKEIKKEKVSDEVEKEDLKDEKNDEDVSKFEACVKIKPTEMKNVSIPVGDHTNLTLLASKKINKHNVTITVKFD